MANLNNIIINNYYVLSASAYDVMKSTIKCFFEDNFEGMENIFIPMAVEYLDFKGFYAKAQKMKNYALHLGWDFSKWINKNTYTFEGVYFLPQNVHEGGINIVPMDKNGEAIPDEPPYFIPMNKMWEVLRDLTIPMVLNW